MSSLSVRTMVLVWTFPARRVTTVTQIYGWAPRRGGRQWRRGTACPVQDHPVMVYIGAGHPAPAKNRASMSARRSAYGLTADKRHVVTLTKVSRVQVCRVQVSAARSPIV